jgi:hypothetical protein
MTELSGNKRRVHTRHEAHGSVCVSAVVLPAGANHQSVSASWKGVAPARHGMSLFMAEHHTQLGDHRARYLTYDGLMASLS